MKQTAILLLHCPDQQGIISEVTRFITDNQGNIVYLDQYVDKQDGMFFMRIEWELEHFLIPRDKIQEYINTLYAQRYQMTPSNLACPMTQPVRMMAASIEPVIAAMISCLFMSFAFLG